MDLPLGSDHEVYNVGLLLLSATMMRRVHFLTLDGSWTVWREHAGFSGRSPDRVKWSKVLQNHKREKSGSCHNRPVTPEGASSSLVGPARCKKSCAWLCAMFMQGEGEHPPSPRGISRGPAGDLRAPHGPPTYGGELCIIVSHRTLQGAHEQSFPMFVPWT